jgi:sensor histidine kinase YesM
VRFPKTLDLSIDCDEALLDRYSVPVSLLQPLVENCVIHAFKDKPTDNRVTVNAALEGQDLVLEVRDNGCGMDRATTEKLLHPQPIDESSAARVMGLENVIQRLYFFYPDDPDVVSIESAENEGTAIIIRIDTEKKPCIAF